MLLICCRNRTRLLRLVCKNFALPLLEETAQNADLFDFRTLQSAHNSKPAEVRRIAGFSAGGS